MKQQLIHYSAKPVLEVYSEKQLCSASTPEGFKPKGFWVSVEGNGDGWLEWCRGENFAEERLKYATPVSLTAKANILKIDSAQGIDKFHEQYGLGTYQVAWDKVAAQYDGIIIAPYIWKKRIDMKVFWYYAWDCASGCIWNAEVVKLGKSVEVCDEEEAA